MHTLINSYRLSRSLGRLLVVLSGLLGRVHAGLLALTHRLLAVTHRLLAVAHRLLAVTHRLLAVAHRLLAGLAGLHGRHTVSLHGGLLRRRLPRVAHLDHLLILLHVSAHLVVADLLLQLYESVIQLRVELVALLQHVLQLGLGHDRLVQLTVELSLGGVLAVGVDKADQGLAVLSNDLGDVLSLGLELGTLREV